MTLPDGLNKCIVCSVVWLLFLQSLKAQLLHAWYLWGICSALANILFSFLQQVGEKKKSRFSCIPAAFDWRARKIICHCNFGCNPSMETLTEVQPVILSPVIKAPPKGPYKIGFEIDSLWRLLKISWNSWMFRSESMQNSVKVEDLLFS